MRIVYLAFGSNLGDRAKNIMTAMCFLEEKEIKLLDVSNLYESEPYGVVNQPAFFNCVGRFGYHGTPERLLDITLEVERKLHRKREKHWGPRTIDIDILLFDTKEYESERLTIPHYDMRNRAFVLIPLLEISPNLLEPGTGFPYRGYLEHIPRDGLKLVKTSGTFLRELKTSCPVSPKGGYYE